MSEQNNKTPSSKHPQAQPLIPMPEFKEQQAVLDFPINQPLTPEEEAMILASGVQMIVGEMANIIATSDDQTNDKNAMKQDIAAFAIGVQRDFMGQTQIQQPRRIQAGAHGVHTFQTNPNPVVPRPDLVIPQNQQPVQAVLSDHPDQMLLPFKQADLDSISEDIDSVFSEVKRLRKELVEIKACMEDTKEIVKEILTKQHFSA